MEIIKAEYYGPCFGVERALEITTEALQSRTELYCLGELIHNNDVIQSYKEQGLIICEDINSLHHTELILRSHGVGKNVYDYCKNHHIDIIDATCPKVRNIHKIVAEHCAQGYQIIIFGNKTHPEVIGIKDWCNRPVMIYKDLEELQKEKPSSFDKSCIVFQTTYHLKKYKEIKEYFNNLTINDMILHNTICNATEKRQIACKDLAKTCDTVLVVGGKQSSNTKKLFEISKEVCENTFWIENSKEIPFNLIKNSKRLGITAGASTPLWIVEEVIFNVRKESNA